MEYYRSSQKEAITGSLVGVVFLLILVVWRGGLVGLTWWFPWMMTMLRGHRDRLAHELGILPERLTGPVFSDTAGGLHDKANTLARWRDFRIIAGYPWVTFRTFRRAIATVLDEAGLSAREIADQLGHSKVSTTQDVYMGHP